MEQNNEMMELEKRVSKLESSKESIIETAEKLLTKTKSEKKSKLEIFILPVVLTLIAVLSSITITYINNKNAERYNEVQKRVQSLDIFQKLISGDSADKEMAVRLLTTIDSSTAVKFAYAISTNRSEKKEIVKAAFNIGKQLDKGRFLEKMLISGNIALHVKESSRTEEEMRKDLDNVFSGYPQLAEKIILVLDRKTLIGNPASFDFINGTANGKLDDNAVKYAIVEAWKNTNGSKEELTLDDITY